MQHNPDNKPSRAAYLYYSIPALLLAFLLNSLTFADAQASWWWPFGPQGIDYSIDFNGIDDETLRWLKTFKLNKPTTEHPPQNLNELAQEEVTLEDRLRQALAAHGYFDVVIDHRLDETAKPPALHYQITPGKRYLLTSVTLDWQGEPLKAVDPAVLTQHSGEPVDMEAINKEALALQKDIGHNTCLLSLTVTPQLELNSTTQTAALVYQIQHGPKANFGTAIVKGNEKVASGVVTRNLGWKQGECFTDAALDKTRSTLVGTQLFSVVRVTHGTQVNEEGEVPIDIDIKERVERTIRFGGSYATDQGFGTKLGWEHRNYFGNGEKVNLDGILAQQEQSLALTMRVPGFRQDNQTLAVTGGIKHENTTAYISQSINAAIALERRLSQHLNIGAGLGYLISRTKDQRIGLQNFGLVSLPLFAEYDTRDNAQDARKGVFGRATITPYLNTFDPSVQFFKTTLTGQTYLSSEMRGKPTLALRGSVGSIYGAPSTDLPSDLRYYAGGGGSVRGYGYQSLSPHFNGEPIGGGSLIELSSEFRVRFSEEIGGVLFVDGGNAYASSLPHLSQKLYYGAGAGLRYYSPMGPLRFDVGVPVNGHDIKQTGYAIYVNLGQSF